MTEDHRPIALVMALRGQGILDPRVLAAMERTPRNLFVDAPFEVKNGEEGLRLVEIHRPALVITDILMPQTDGLEVIRELRRGAPRIPTLAISGGHAIYLRMAKRLGASAILAKPFRPMDILRAVDELLAS